MVLSFGGPLSWCREPVYGFGPQNHLAHCPAPPSRLTNACIPWHVVNKRPTGPEPLLGLG